MKLFEITPEMLDRALDPKPFGSNITLTVCGVGVPVIDFALTLPKPEIDTVNLLSTFTTTNVEIKGEFKMTPEQEEELSKWWAEQWERELMRQICGEPSEYQHSLRAAGAKV